MRVCGFCITGYHSQCAKRIEHYEKAWVCDCPYCKTPEYNTTNLPDRFKDISNGE